MSHNMQLNKEGTGMINKKELRKALTVHDVTVQMIADAASVNVSTVYRWLQFPEKMTVGNIELIKNMTGMNREEFLKVFYCSESRTKCEMEGA